MTVIRMTAMLAIQWVGLVLASGLWSGAGPPMPS